MGNAFAMITCLALLLLTTPISGAPAGASNPPVLLLKPGDQPIRRGLLQALRIQQVDFTVLDTEVPTSALTTDRALAHIDKYASVLAVWTDIGKTNHLLHIVGRRAGEPFRDRMHFEGGDNATVDRAFALKVRAVLDEVMVAEVARLQVDLEVRPVPDIWFTGTARPPDSRGKRDLWLARPAAALLGARLLDLPVARPGRAEVLASAPEPQPGHRWGLEVGARGARGSSGTRASAALSVTRRMNRGRSALEAYAELVLDAGTTTSSTAGTVRSTRSEAMLGLRALAAPARGNPARRLQGGGYLGLGIHLVGARGTTPLGATGSGRRLVPTLAAGLEARLALRRWLALRAALGGDLSLRRQRFSINGVLVTDMGRYRAQGRLSLLLFFF